MICAIFLIDSVVEGFGPSIAPCSVILVFPLTQLITNINFTKSSVLNVLPIEIRVIELKLGVDFLINSSSCF